MENEKIEKRYYTVAEFHALLSNTVTKSMIYKMIANGEIPTRKIGRKILIPADWVHAFIDTPCIAVKTIYNERKVSLNDKTA